MKLPSAAKAVMILNWFMYGLKAVPFNNLSFPACC
jgi:hypothetical protein